MPIGPLMQDSARVDTVTKEFVGQTDFYHGTTNTDKLYYDPLVTGFGMIMFTRFPGWVDQVFPHARQLLQKNFAGLDGIADIELGTADVQEGFSQNGYQVAQNIGAKTNNFSLKHLEYSGSLISRIYNFWVSGIRDPDTGIATYPKMFGIDYAAYNHTCEMMYVSLRPDANNFENKNVIEFAAYFTAAFPKKISIGHFNYAKASQNGPVEIDQNFSGVMHIGPGVDALATRLLRDENYRKVNILEASDYEASGEQRMGYTQAGADYDKPKVNGGMAPATSVASQY